MWVCLFYRRDFSRTESDKRDKEVLEHCLNNNRLYQKVELMYSSENRIVDSGGSRISKRGGRAYGQF